MQRLTTKSEDLPPVQNGQLSGETRRENTREELLDGQNGVDVEALSLEENAENYEEGEVFKGEVSIDDDFVQLDDAVRQEDLGPGFSISYSDDESSNQEAQQAQETTTSATPELKKKNENEKECDNIPWTVVPNKKPSKKKPSNKLLADRNLGDPLARADVGDEVFDFAIYDDTIARLYESEKKILFVVEEQESFSIDVARFFPGYLEMTSGFISSDRIRLDIKKIDMTKECVLKVKKYDPRYGLCFRDRSHATPCEDFRDSDSTTLSINLELYGAINDLKEYSKDRKEFGLIELWLEVDGSTKLSSIKFEWDSTRQIVVPSFYNYQLQMGRTQIAKSDRNRIGNQCTFIKEAFFDPNTCLALIVPKAECRVRLKKNMFDCGLRYLHTAWRVSLNVPEWIEISPTKPLGINQGNPRTRKGVDEKLAMDESIIVQFDRQGTGLSGYFELRKNQGKLEAGVVHGPPPLGWNNGGESQRSSRCSSIRSRNPSRASLTSMRHGPLSRKISSPTSVSKFC